MKKVHYLILSLCFPLMLHAQENDSVLLRAEQYYRQNDFSKAIVEYQSLVDAGWTSAELYYNLGNACFRNNDVTSAILYYERAKRLAPGDEAIAENLNLSRSLIFDKVEAVPEMFIITWGKSFRDLTTIRAWSWCSIGSFIALLALTLLVLFSRRMSIRRFAFTTGVLCFLFSITSFSMAYLQKANIERTDEAIVFTPSVTIRSSPEDSSANLFIVHEGIKLHIEDSIDDWYFVRIADGNKGWIRTGDLKII